MPIIKSNLLKMENINDFKFSIKYVNLTSEEDSNKNFHHNHSQCEIYINLTGNVSFMVEDNTYSIKPGNVIITKPYENHHCIYHSDANHKHFWILFEPNNNETVLDLFMNRKNGENNRLMLSADIFDKVNKICENMLNEQTSLSAYMNFFTLLHFLNTAKVKNHTNELLTSEISSSLEYITKNLNSPIKISDIAKEVCMSITSFERTFKKQMGISPKEYIKRKKLYMARKLLDEGKLVQEVCDTLAFCDCSHFIQVFKNHFGITPHQYKQKNRNNNFEFTDF